MRGTQSISEAIMGNGLVSLKESFYHGANSTRLAQLDNMILRSAEGVIHPSTWDPGTAPNFEIGPALWASVGLLDFDAPPFNFTTSLPFPYYGTFTSADVLGGQSWSVLGMGHRLSGQTTFLTHAADMGGGNLAASLRDLYPTWLENKVALFIEAEDTGIL